MQNCMMQEGVSGLHCRKEYVKIECKVSMPGGKEVQKMAANWTAREWKSNQPTVWLEG